MVHGVGRSVKVVILLLSGVWLGLGPGMLRADGPVPYRHYQTHDGLPSNHVTALPQTANGLLWTGTEAGLVVYDGEEFRPIPFPDPLQTGSISSIQPRPDGSVWVGLYQGTVMKASQRGVERVIRFEPSAATLSRVLARGKTLLFVTTRAVWTLAPGAKHPSRRAFKYEMRPPSEIVGAPASVGTGPGTLLSGRRGRSGFWTVGSVPVGFIPMGRSPFSTCPVRNRIACGANFGLRVPERSL